MKNEKAEQGIKYLFIGGGTAFLELGIYSFLFYVLCWPIPLANILAVSVATIVNFALNRSWAFKSQENLLRSMLLYALLFVCNMIITTIIISTSTAAGLPSAAVKFATQILVAVWNFFLYRYAIFK